MSEEIAVEGQAEFDALKKRIQVEQDGATDALEAMRLQVFGEDGKKGEEKEALP